MDNSSTKEKEMTVSDFSKQLKEGTKKSHSMAENTSFVASFLRGVLDEIKYRQLVANFYFIYQRFFIWNLDNLKMYFFL